MAHDDVATRSNDTLVRAIRRPCVCRWYAIERSASTIDSFRPLLLASAQLQTVRILMPCVASNVVDLDASTEKPHLCPTPWGPDAGKSGIVLVLVI